MGHVRVVLAKKLTKQQIKKKKGFVQREAMNNNNYDSNNNVHNDRGEKERSHDANTIITHDDNIRLFKHDRVAAVGVLRQCTPRGGGGCGGGGGLR